MCINDVLDVICINIVWLSRCAEIDVEIITVFVGAIIEKSEDRVYGKWK